MTDENAYRRRRYLARTIATEAERAARTERRCGACGERGHNATTCEERRRAEAIEVALPAHLRPRAFDLLWHQLHDDDWLTPQRMGGTDGSHHSGTLAGLVRRGLVERRERPIGLGGRRRTYEYRRTPAGQDLVARVLGAALR